MASLFDNTQHSVLPLAESMRPKDLKDVIGQSHLLQSGGPLKTMLDSGSLSSLILWGPPGCGKTTLARLIANLVDFEFASLSAVLSGVADVRRVFERAEKFAKTGRRTLLFVDEIHRFNRAQQDSFLAHMEDGRLVLLGATTENPSFELNGALLSRAQVLTLNPLTEEHFMALLAKAEMHLKVTLPLAKASRDLLPSLADGDARYFINLIEIIHRSQSPQDLTPQDLEVLLQKRRPLYDKSQEGHYNLISALHKSLRGSDPDASLYWFNRMMQGGEDPKYLLRRLIRFAVEDISLADPQALVQANATQAAYHTLGSPEGDLAIAQLVVYLATAPKSNALYQAQKQALKAAQASGSSMPPKHILNAPTKLMQNEGYGEGYIYDHDTPEGFSGQNYFPKEFLERPTFYHPVERGFERDLKKRLAYWNNLRKTKA